MLCEAKLRHACMHYKYRIKRNIYCLIVQILTIINIEKVKNIRDQNICIYTQFEKWMIERYIKAVVIS